MKKILLFIMFLFPLLSMGQTTLTSGDIVIMEFKGNGSDDGFSFMPLVDLSTGTTINFTDYGWNGTSFNIGEDGNPTNGGNMITYTAPSTITAGTLIRQNTANIGGSAFTATSGWAYNFNNYNYIYGISSTVSGHDGLIVFQGSYTSPSFIWAYHTGQWGKGSYADFYWSNLPSTLTNGTNALYFIDLASGSDVTVDDGYYSGPTTAATPTIWRSRVANSANWTTSVDVSPTLLYPNSYSVTGAVVAPTATTNAASSITTTGAILNGTINANNSSTTVTFEYGTSTSYGTTVTATQSPVTGSTATAVSYTLSGLTPNTSYHFRVVGVNAGGTTNGSDATFTTTAAAPTATTLAASSITSTGAMLNGTINANNSSTTVTFDYGTTVSYGSSVTASQSPVTGTSATSVSYSLPGLTRNTTYHFRVKGVNAGGTTNGSDLTFATSAVAPTITTQAVSSIASTTAIGNGNITDLGAPNPTAYGVCWNTTGTPTTSDSKNDKGSASATGAFTASITGLTASTTYYVRAFATNTAGTSYGSVQTFMTNAALPFVTEHFTDETTGTSTFTNSGFTFNLTGSKLVVANGAAKGWSGAATDDYYLDNYGNYLVSAGVLGSITNSLATFKVSELFVLPGITGAAVSNSGTVIIRGKLSGVTQYTYTLASGDINLSSSTNNSWTYVSLSAYSSTSIDQLEFELTGSLRYLGLDAFKHVSTALDIAATVTTQAVSSISTTTATGNGTITYLGQPNPTAYGVCWNTTGTPTISSSKVDKGAASATGAFVASMTGLAAGTTYFVRSFATNNAGTSYGTEVSFTTTGIVPTVTTQAVNSISSTTATGNGNITNLGEPNPTAYGVCWNTTGTPTISDSKVDNGAASVTGVFTAALTGLSANTTYHVRAFATNTAGTSYGEEVTFTSLGIAPTVTTQAVTAITTNSATGNGNITNLGLPNPTAYGICWNTTGTPTTTDYNVNLNSASSTGAFSASMTSLSANTTYFVRAYATNSGGTGYGDEVSFTTIGMAANLTTGDIVILEFNGNGSSDGFSFMPLVDLASGTTIYFTDYGWNGTSRSFHPGEEGNPTGGGTTITYVAPTDITAGTIVRPSGAITLNSLSTGHDGIIAYQGSSSSPTFLWAYHTGQWGKGSYADYYWSDLPTGLTNGTNAVYFADNAGWLDITVDDGVYSGPITAATPADWRVRVANNANWTTSSDATTTAPTGSYPVIVKPTVNTAAASTIASTSAIMGGEVTADGGGSVSERGVVYSSSNNNPTIGGLGVTQDTNGSGTGTFSKSITSLTPGTIYYFNTYATNTLGTSYGTVASFTTLKLPTVSTQVVSSIGATTAIGNGNITSLGNPNPTQYGVCWNTGGTPTTSDIKTTQGTVSATGAFTSSMTSLTAGTTYHVRAYATNTAGTNYGEEQDFTTLTVGTFTGATDTDWATTSNWAGGAVPDAGTNVTIPSGKTVIIGPTTSANCNNLTVDASGSLTIQSSATGTGSLIVSGSVTGNATVQRYMTASAWHMISSPVSGQSVGSFLTSNATISTNPGDATQRAMKTYNETTNLWNALLFNSSPGDVNVGDGFAVWPGSSGTVSFSGALNTGTTNVSVVRNGPGWNCVGNPYTSAIAINSSAGSASGTGNFINTNTNNIDPSYAAIYVWEQGTYAYTIINQSSGAFYAQLGQGFFVKDKTGGTQVNFTSTLQTHQPTATFKSEFVAWPEIKLNASLGELSSSAIVKFNEEMSRGLDFGFDAGIMRTGFDVYTKLVEDNGVDFGIQCLPLLTDEEMVIPVGFESKQEGIISLSIGITNLPTEFSIILEDRQTGISTLVADAGSRINVAVSADSKVSGRYFLHVSKASSPNRITELANNLTVYTTKGQICIAGKIKGNATATLYDEEGRSIRSTKLQSGALNTLPSTDLRNGIYLLNIQQQDRLFTKKVVVNN